MYEQFYNLRERPFALTPDPEYLYSSRAHTEALRALRYGIESQAGIVVITGEIGSGKTTILRTVLRDLNRQMALSWLVNTALDGRQLLEATVLDFGLEAPRDRHERQLLGDLARFLGAERAAGRRALLVIDEAQNVDLAALDRMLSNLESVQATLLLESAQALPLQVVLIGQPQLREALSTTDLEQLTQRIGVRYHLPSLDASDTAAYINHRLRRASLGSALEFPPEVCELIHRQCGGVPRRINILCDAVLLCAWSDERRTIDLDSAQSAIAMLETTGIAAEDAGDASAMPDVAELPPVTFDALDSFAPESPVAPAIQAATAAAAVAAAPAAAVGHARSVVSLPPDQSANRPTRDLFVGVAETGRAAGRGAAFRRAAMAIAALVAIVAAGAAGLKLLDPFGSRSSGAATAASVSIAPQEPGAAAPDNAAADATAADMTPTSGLADPDGTADPDSIATADRDPGAIAGPDSAAGLPPSIPSPASSLSPSSIAGPQAAATPADTAASSRAVEQARSATAALNVNALVAATTARIESNIAASPSTMPTPSAGVSALPPAAPNPFAALPPAAATPPATGVTSGPASGPASGSATVASAAAAPSVNTSPAASPSVFEERSVRAVVNQYRTAFNTLNVDAAKAIWPSVDARALSRLFGQLESQTFEFDGCEVSIAGPHAVVACNGRARFVAKVGEKTPHDELRHWTFDLERLHDQWTIQRVEAR